MTSTWRFFSTETVLTKLCCLYVLSGEIIVRMYLMCVMDRGLELKSMESYEPFHKDTWGQDSNLGSKNDTCSHFEPLSQPRL